MTDGVLEASAPGGPVFGVERAQESVRGCRRESPDAITAALLRAARAFAPGAQADDMTAVVIQADRHPSQKDHLTPDRDGRAGRAVAVRTAGA